jgi:pilus assembly protein CpaE
VLNRANSKVGLSRKEIEAALKVEIANEIPSERVVPISVNRGNPAVLAEPGSDYTKAIRALAKSVVPKDQTDTKTRRRGFSLVRS